MNNIKFFSNKSNFYIYQIELKGIPSKHAPSWKPFTKPQLASSNLFPNFTSQYLRLQSLIFDFLRWSFFLHHFHKEKMSTSVFLLFFAVMPMLLAQTTPHLSSGPHIADVNILLPPKMTHPVEYRLQGSDGCFKWYYRLLPLFFVFDFFSKIFK